MSNISRIIMGALAAVLLAGAGAYWWFVADGAPPANLAAYPVELAAMRAAADELPGGKPTDIRVEQVASFSFPAVAAVAGDGWEGLPLGAFSFQLVLPADTVVIDAALDAATAAGLSATVDAAAQARMEAALAEATQIVVTHEHADHVGGIVAHPEPQLLARALRLNREQLEGLPRFGAALPAALAETAPLEFSGTIAIAPGVVLVRAPGHTAGSQMVYVRREDGRELLFVGDIAWTARNLESGRGRPRLVSQFVLNEDRDAVLAQLAALRTLQGAAPELLLVPGHDPVGIEALVAAGAMQRGFVPAPF